MSIEERFEFLFKSIESHDQQIGELVERQAKTDQRLEQMAKHMEIVFDLMQKGFQRMEKGFERMEKGFERTQQNFDRLTLAMTGLTEHVADRARRVESLENR